MDRQTQDIVKTAAGFGLSLPDSAFNAGLTPEALRDEIARNPELHRVIIQQRVELKRGCLEKLIAAKQWQASKFLLETLWPAQFGRGRKRKTKKPAGLSDAQRVAKLNDEEIEQLRQLMNKMDAPQSPKSHSSAR